MAEADYDRKFDLKAESELRFKVCETFGSQVTMVLKRGLAEAFGTELVPQQKYVLEANTRLTVFTFQGCMLTLSGSVEFAEVFPVNPMIILVNIHAAIEQKRQIADENHTRGPVVLVVGPKDVGKSTLCKFLINYAIRMGRAQTFVDLDCGQGEVLPSTIAAIHVREPISIEKGYLSDNVKVYHVGHNSPGHNLKLYNSLIEQLATDVKSRLRNPIMAAHGLIINTGGWVKGEGYKSITKAIYTFEANIVLVVGKEGLYHQINRDVPQFVKVVYVPKFAGVANRSQEERIENRENQVGMYFFNHCKGPQPHSFKVKFSDLRIYKIMLKHPNDSFPSGSKQVDGNLYLVPVKVGLNLLNHILSVTFAKNIDDNIIYKNVAGFICVTEVDIPSKTLTIMSPEPPPLPGVILLYSDSKFTRQLLL